MRVRSVPREMALLCDSLYGRVDLVIITMCTVCLYGVVLARVAVLDRYRYDTSVSALRKDPKDPGSPPDGRRQGFDVDRIEVVPASPRTSSSRPPRPQYPLHSKVAPQYQKGHPLAPRHELREGEAVFSVNRWLCPHSPSPYRTCRRPTPM